MVKGFSPALVALLYAAVASCSPVMHGEADNEDASWTSTGPWPSSSGPWSSHTGPWTSATASSWSSAAGPWPTSSGATGPWPSWTASSTGPPPASATVPFASDNPNYVAWTPYSDIVPQPVNGAFGADFLGPQNIPVELQNADTLAPPTTDAGSIPNSKWPMSLSPQILVAGGWVREETTGQMPIATSLAGAQVRLEVGTIRELHWHNVAEWSYMIAGYVQITAVDQNGQNYVGTAGPGDLWYFPPGIPHSLQATNQSVGGAEFMLMFNDGAFPADDTFLLTGKLNCRAPDWLPHLPKEVIAKNFQTEISDWDGVPSRSLYIFPADPPTTSQIPENALGEIPNPFVFPFSQVEPIQGTGGSIKIADSSTFKASLLISAAEVTVEPGAMRELHWHPNADEWDYFLEGTGRMTVYAGAGNARTWDFEAGDVAYVDKSNGHYVENIGNTTLKFLEIFASSQFEDVSLAQWLALTPEAVVEANVGITQETIATFNKTKQYVVGPSSN